MPTIIHSTKLLHYHLIEGAPALEPLRILDTRRLKWQGWSVELFVLGASHAVRLTSGPKVLTEMLSCIPPPTVYSALLNSDVNSPRDLCAQVHGLTCRVRLTPFALAGNDALKNHFDTSDQMHVLYPGSDTVTAPCTRIGWRSDGAYLLVETVHTYPEEGQAVRSETRFILEEAGS
jgi:hypothetical protein